MTGKNINDGQVEIESGTERLDEKVQLAGLIFAPQRVLQGIGASIILVLSVFVTVAVILRYTGNAIIGVVEITSLAMVVITVLVIPAATAADENFRVEVVEFFVKAKCLVGLEVLSVILHMLVAGFLVFSSADLLVNDLRTGTTMGGELGMPRWWVSLPITLGFLGFMYSSILATRRLRKPLSSNSTLGEG